MNWFDDPDALPLMARYMARAGYSAHDVAEMIARPWHWDTEWQEALAWAQRTQLGFAAIDTGGGAVQLTKRGAT